MRNEEVEYLPRVPRYGYSAPTPRILNIEYRIPVGKRHLFTFPRRYLFHVTQGAALSFHRHVLAISGVSLPIAKDNGGLSYCASESIISRIPSRKTRSCLHPFHFN